MAFGIDDVLSDAMRGVGSLIPNFMAQSRQSDAESFNTKQAAIARVSSAANWYGPGAAPTSSAPVRP